MRDYDYLNARIKGMSTQLLTREFYNQVLAVKGQDVLIDTLLNSPYGPALRESLTVKRGPAAAESALRRNLFQTFDKVRSLAPSGPRSLLSVQFRRWDVANIQTILRGKLSGAPAAETVAALFPAGELDEARLLALVDEPDAVAVADTLTAWGAPFAFELRRLLRDRAGAVETVRIETTLTREFFGWALAGLSAQDANENLIRTHIRCQIDLANVMAALLAVRQREAGRGPEPTEPIPCGRIEGATLRRIEACLTLDRAFEPLAATYLAPGVERGILAFGEQRRLEVMERFLETVVIGIGCRMFRADPLGVGVPAGYVWRKFNEFLNLRILLYGKVYGWPAAAIREELFLV